MGIFTASKLKTIALFSILIAALSLAVSTSLALFTDVRETTGVFTAGNVYISLTEAAVKPDAEGNLVEDTSKDRVSGAEIAEGGTPTVHNYGVVFPGQRIFKDPTVKNIGSESAWVAVKVIITDGGGDIHRLYSYSDDYDDIDIERLLEGRLLAEDVHVGEWNGIPDVCYNSNYAMIQVSSHRDGKYEFYFLMEKPLNSGDSVTVFDTLYIDDMFGNSEMLEFRELQVTVQAFAVQKFGFTSCFDAMINAFPTHFVGLGE